MKRRWWIGLGILALAGCGVEVSIESLPLAHAGLDQVVPVVETVALDGNRSRNGGGDSVDGLAFGWTLIARPEASGAVLRQSDTATPTFVADRAGTFIIRLVVREGDTASRADYVNILVRSVVAVEWTVPADGDLAVSPTTPVVIGFSAPLQSASVHSSTIGLTDTSGSSVATRISLESANRVVVLHPAATLQPTTRYQLLISQGVTDSLGITLAEPMVVWFTTAGVGADTVPPRVIATKPRAGDTIEPSAVIRVVFSEPIATATVDATSFSVVATTGAAVPGSLWVDAAGVRATFVPRDLFAPIAYNVSLSSAITDSAGNHLDADGNGTPGGSFTLDFTVSSAIDMIPPHVVAVIPGNGFVEVRLGTTILIELSEAVTEATVNPAHVFLSDATGELVAAALALDPTRRVMSLDPDAPLTPGTTFTITVKDAVTDFAGVGLDGDGDGRPGGDFTSRFTAGTPTGVTGTVTVPASILPGAHLLVTLRDADLDLGATSDHAAVTVVSNQGESESLVLSETGPTSGAFSGTLPTAFADFGARVDNNGFLELQAGDSLTVGYQDMLNGSGTASTVSATVVVQGGSDGTLAIVRSSENVLSVTVRDHDVVANPSIATGFLECGTFSPCVQISSSSTGDTEDLLFVAQSQFGVFATALNHVVATVAVPNNGVLETASTATIEARYTDALRENGDNRGVEVLASTALSLAKIVIRNAPGGGGNAVDSMNLRAGDSVTVYAAGYGPQESYLGDQSVNWTVTGNIGGVTPAQGMSALFEARRVGTGYVTATHPDTTVTPDDTGIITVTAGGLATILVRDAADGGGNEVGDTTPTTDQSLSLYAAGYDAEGNFQSNVVVTWSVRGDIGVVQPLNGPMTVFDATTMGTGSVRATHAVGFDDTGTINVLGGTLAQIVIYSAAGGPQGGGTAVGTLTVGVGDLVNLNAAGFDADGNFLGDQSVIWTVIGSIGTVGPPGTPATLFNPETAGTGQVRAFHVATGLSDVTGLITVRPRNLHHILIRTVAGGGGEEVGNLVLEAGQSVSLFAAGYDAGDNFIADQIVSWSRVVHSGTVLGNVIRGPAESTVFDPEPFDDGVVVITADHATAIGDATGSVLVVPTRVPQVLGVAPATGYRSRTGVSLVVNGSSFDCAGAGPAVTFLPAGNVTAVTVDACAATRLDITINLPCSAQEGTYDVRVSNPDGESGTGARLFTVITEVEGPYGVASCADARDNDCDGATDAADSDCGPPTAIAVACTTPSAYTSTMACAVDLDSVADQAANLVCTVEPQVTTLFSDPFDDLSGWSTGTGGVECSLLPTGCAAHASDTSWTAQRTINTLGMDRVCLDFRIAKINANAGEGITISFDPGTGYVTAFDLDFGTWHVDELRHDDQATTAADYHKNVCLTDITPAAANNVAVGLRLSLRSNSSGDHVFLDDMIVTGMGGTQTNVFCDGFASLANWTVIDGTITVDELGNNNAAQAESAASMIRCFDASHYDVLDFSFNPAQENEDRDNHLYADLSVSGASGSFAQMVDIWYNSATNRTGSWNRNARLLETYKLFRLTDFDPAAVRNANTCVQLRFASDDDELWVDDVCVDGFVHDAGALGLGAISDAGGGRYDFTVSATRPVSAEVRCTWSLDSLTLITDGGGGNSLPATVRFTP